MNIKIYLFLLIFTFCALNATAQSAGLSGRITPQQPGVEVANIEVFAVNTTTGDVNRTFTDAQGLYSFASLATGVTQQISPARKGYGFSPAVRFVQHNGASINVDFIAVTIQSAQRTANDFDGDGRSDQAVFRASDSTWYIAPSGSQSNLAAPAAYYGIRWGLPGDVPTPFDFDGDSKTDIAVWRPSDATNPNKSYFYILNSSNNSVRVEQFGVPTDQPFVAGDWDGDGKDDPAVYRDSANGTQSYFYYRGSLNNPAGNITYLPWGAAGDMPMRGDFDADGRQDAAVFRPSDQVWYILQSSNNQSRHAHWGIASDKFVPADYDGDGKTDLAVFRNGVWHIRQSSNNQSRYIYWGLNSDKPVPADYDGDGKTDIAVNREGAWYILESSSGQGRTTRFGLATDAPVQAFAFSRSN